jgi:hypothetical protein
MRCKLDGPVLLHIFSKCHVCHQISCPLMATMRAAYRNQPRVTCSLRCKTLQGYSPCDNEHHFHPSLASHAWASNTRAAVSGACT